MAFINFHAFFPQLLCLIEDEIILFNHFENYLTKTNVHDWKYDGPENQLLDPGSHSTVETADLQKIWFNIQIRLT